MELIEKYSKKIDRLLSNLDCPGFAPNFTAKEFIAGTKDKFLELIVSDPKSLDAEEDLKVLITALEQELNQDIIDELRITSYYAQIIRDKLGLSVYINCGFRPVLWEHFMSRSGGSMHCKGFAFDFYCTGLRRAIDLINMMFALGGRHHYESMRFIHFDRRRSFAHNF